MEWLHRFLKLRKQNDDVKILLLLFILGVVMLGRTVYNGIRVYRDIGQPVEYVLLSSGLRGITESALKEIKDTDYVASVGVEKRMNLTIKRGENEEYMECFEISPSYLEEVYGAKASGAMKTFYLTPKAYQMLHNNEKKDNGKTQINYLLGEEESGIAKIVLLDNEMFSEEVYAFCQGNTKKLAEEGEEIRVYVTKKDLDGTTIRHFQNLGYTLDNTETVKETEYMRQMLFTKIKYEAVIGILCFGFDMMGVSMLRKKNMV